METSLPLRASRFSDTFREKAAKAGAERKDPRDGVRDSDVKLSADVCKLSTADRR